MNASVLLMVSAPRPGACKRRLQPLLGPDGCARLQAVLIARAAAWAQSVAPGRVCVAHTPADAGPDFKSLARAGAQVFAQEGEGFSERLAAAADRARAPDGPLLIAGADLPALTPAHALGALGDMEAGCDVSVGPATGGGFYLLALRDGLPELLQAGGADASSGHLAALLGAAAAGSLRVGLLRSERDLRTPEDARAALADPLTPSDVRAALAA